MTVDIKLVEEDLPPEKILREEKPKKRANTPCRFVCECPKYINIDPGYYRDICQGHIEGSSQNQDVHGCNNGFFIDPLVEYLKR